MEGTVTRKSRANQVMNKALRQKFKQAVEASMKDEASVTEKAYAARKLADTISEAIEANGPKRAGRLMRSMMKTAAALHPSTHAVTLEEIAEVGIEIERQKQGLN